MPQCIAIYCDKCYFCQRGARSDSDKVKFAHTTFANFGSDVNRGKGESDVSRGKGESDVSRGKGGSDVSRAKGRQ